MYSFIVDLLVCTCACVPSQAGQLGGDVYARISVRGLPQRLHRGLLCFYSCCHRAATTLDCHLHCHHALTQHYHHTAATVVSVLATSVVTLPPHKSQTSPHCYHSSPHIATTSTQKNVKRPLQRIEPVSGGGLAGERYKTVYICQVVGACMRCVYMW